MNIYIHRSLLHTFHLCPCGWIKSMQLLQPNVFQASWSYHQVINTLWWPHCSTSYARAQWPLVIISWYDLRKFSEASATQTPTAKCQTSARMVGDVWGADGSSSPSTCLNASLALHRGMPTWFWMMGWLQAASNLFDDISCGGKNRESLESCENTLQMALLMLCSNTIGRTQTGNQ